MITGDNPLTACHVAKELKFTQKQTTLLLKNTGEKDNWVWESVNQSTRLAIDVNSHKELVSNFDLCITGEVSWVV